MRKIFSLFFTGTFVIVAAGCSPTPAPIPTVQDIFAPTFTALALTVQAQFLTQTALAPGATPISTPPPTATYLAPIIPAPLATTGCADLAQFVGDVNLSRGTTVKAGEPFTKIWRIKNAGTCVWNERYMLVFAAKGNLLNAQSSLPIILPGASVPPGTMIDVSMAFQAPGTAGAYQSYWNLLDDSGKAVKIDNGDEGTALFVEIVVEGGNKAGQGTANPTPLVSVQFSAPELIWGAQCAPEAAYLITANLSASGPAAGTIQFSSGGNGALEAIDGAYEFTDAGVSGYTFMASGPYADPAHITIHATLNGQVAASLVIPCP